MQAAAQVCVGASAPLGLAPPEGSHIFQMRDLGKTRAEVAKVNFGHWATALQERVDKASRATLEDAFDTIKSLL